MTAEGRLWPSDDDVGDDDDGDDNHVDLHLVGPHLSSPHPGGLAQDHTKSVRDLDCIKLPFILSHPFTI